jgi:hypothetical protein
VLQGLVAFAYSQAPLLQVSAVQALESSQSASIEHAQLPLAGCVHRPPLHTSAVQPSPSSAHSAELSEYWQIPPLQTSSVQGSESSQSAAAAHEQVPLDGCVHKAPLHTSAVQPFPSSAQAAAVAV